MRLDDGRSERVDIVDMPAKNLPSYLGPFAFYGCSVIPEAPVSIMHWSRSHESTHS